MKTALPRTRQEWTNLLLAIFTGASFAAAVIIILSSRLAGSIVFAKWQIAAIYLVSIAMALRLGIKDSRLRTEGRAVAEINAEPPL